MDGAFGFTGNAFNDPEQGALAGLAKTAALEWQSVICRAIDLSPEFSAPDEAGRQAWPNCSPSTIPNQWKSVCARIAGWR
jgi:hypothetical protein